MKKFSIFLMSALALGFTACSDDDEHGEMMVNPQEPVMEAGGVAVALPDATAQSVVLSEYAEDGNIPMLTITKLENLPANYEVIGMMEVSTNESFVPAKQLPMTLEGGTLYVKTQDWEDAHLALYSKNPRPVQSWVRTRIYAVNGTSTVSLGGAEGVYFAQHEVEVTPLPAKNEEGYPYEVEEAYYAVIGGEETAMNPTNPADVYDPPTFSTMQNVEEGQTISVMIKSESGKMYGKGAEGELVENGSAIVLDQQGPRLLTINMEEMTYKVDLALAEIIAYNASPSGGYPLTTTNYINYNGFIGFRGAASFRLCDKKTKPTIYWGNAWEGNKEEPTLIPGHLVMENPPKPVEIGEKGLYFLKVNLGSLTYEADPIEYFGLIGGFNGWGGDVVMEHTDRYFMVWSCDLTVETADPFEFKIRTNGDWDGEDLGTNVANGTQDDELTEHGGNITWTLGAGDFTITLDLTKSPLKLQIVKK